MKESQPTEKRTDINTLGEFGLITHLTKDHVNLHKETLLGVGDDAAIIKSSKGMVQVVSTDMMVEGIHFDLTYHPLMHLGYKAVVVNLSDIYAMNGRPKQITFSMAISNRFSVEALEELYAGVYAACEKYGVDLVGGDTTSSRMGLVMSITAIGEVEEKKFVRRNTAKAGDVICVTGDLGAAYVGLQLLEREKTVYQENPEIQPDMENEKYILQRQLRPEARVDVIEVLEDFKVIPTSMIDVSDGLSSELFHLATGSGIGCKVKEEELPISKYTYNRAVKFGIDPTTCALNGGEDYELLFTVSPEDAEKIKDIADISIIGEMTKAADGFKLISKQGKVHNLEAQGWKHI